MIFSGYLLSLGDFIRCQHDCSHLNISENNNTFKRNTLKYGNVKTLFHLYQCFEVLQDVMQFWLWKIKNRKIRSLHRQQVVYFPYLGLAKLAWIEVCAGDLQASFKLSDFSTCQDQGKHSRDLKVWTEMRFHSQS